MPRCGIPTITLLGTKEDWKSIEKKLDMLPRLGSEPKLFSELLKPVLKYMVASFDNPNDSKVLKFWRTIVHEKEGFSGGCGPWSKRGYPPHLSGWLTAFCFWDTEGECLYRKPKGFRVDFTGDKLENAGCQLDGVLYHRISALKIPRGSAAVPVTLVDPKGWQHPMRMVAGSVGIKVMDAIRENQDSVTSTTSIPRNTAVSSVSALRWLSITNESPSVVEEEESMNTLQPVSGWWIYMDRQGRAVCAEPIPVVEGRTENDIPVVVEETFEPEKLQQVLISAEA
jgi:hypothetical protein